jgi:hypothetical protein
VLAFWKTATDDDVEGMLPSAILLNRFLGTAFRGKFEAHPRDFVPTDPEIACRMTDENHVNVLMKTSKSTGDSSRRNMGCCLSARLAKQEVVTHEEACKSNKGVMIVSGEHNKLMALRLLAKHPNNKIWQRYIYTLFVAENSETSRRMFRMIGNIENLKSAANRKLTFAQRLFQMHTQAGQLAYRHNCLIKDLNKRAVANLKADWQYSLALCKNSLTSLWSVASCSEEMWAPLWKVVTGDVLVDPFKKPGSHGPFVNMSGIPEEMLIGWLNQVIHGDYPLSKFKVKCLIHKAGIEVKKVTVQHLQLKCEQAKIDPIPIQCFEDAEERMPELDKVWFDHWTAYFKNKLNSTKPKAEFYEVLNTIFGMWQDHSKPLVTCFFQLDLFVF